MSSERDESASVNADGGEPQILDAEKDDLALVRCKDLIALVERDLSGLRLIAEAVDRVIASQEMLIRLAKNPQPVRVRTR